MNITKVYEICGATNETKRIYNYHGMILCSKHKKQMYEYGKITDPTKRTQQDKNEIIIHDTYAEIVIRNRKNIILCNAIIDIEDVEKVSKYKWRLDSTKKNGKGGYVATGSKNNRKMLHRFILNYEGDLQVDHINRNRYDNRKENLRIVTSITNSQNIDAKNIRAVNGKYRVEIMRFGKLYNLGTFNTLEEAKNIKKDFLNKIEDSREVFEKNYRDKQPNIKNIRFTESRKYIIDIFAHNKHYKFDNIPTLKEAIELRDKKIKELRK